MKNKIVEFFGIDFVVDMSVVVSVVIIIVSIASIIDESFKLLLFFLVLMGGTLSMGLGVYLLWYFWGWIYGDKRKVK